MTSTEIVDDQLNHTGAPGDGCHGRCLDFVSVAHSTDPAVQLRVRTRPNFESAGQRLRVVDLFSGCGGLSLGIAQASIATGASIDVRLALDSESVATDVYKANFPGARVVTDSVLSVFDGEGAAPPTNAERTLAEELGPIDFLVGGPPCQGHSNLNNRTRRSDPKNDLYLSMARAARVLRPRVVVIENVPAVRLATADVVRAVAADLESQKYKVATTVVGMHALGVAQLRKRHVLLAIRPDGPDPEAVLARLTGATGLPAMNLRSAIGDLEHMSDRKGFDLIPVASPTNLQRMRYLLDRDLYDLPNAQRPACHQGNHSYKSMYGRLDWSLPAQTITSGFGSIGQGRYMHPSQTRALTAHEAARLQGFPDYFSFESVVRRSDLATMIGNAVPPALMRALTAELISYVTSSSKQQSSREEIAPAGAALAS